jgi:hypothetical protein
VAKESAVHGAVRGATPLLGRTALAGTARRRGPRTAPIEPGGPGIESCGPGTERRGPWIKHRGHAGQCVRVTRIGRKTSCHCIDVRADPLQRRLPGDHRFGQRPAQVGHASLAGRRRQHDPGVVQPFRVQQAAQVSDAVFRLLGSQQVGLVQRDRDHR